MSLDCYDYSCDWNISRADLIKIMWNTIATGLLSLMRGSVSHSALYPSRSSPGHYTKLVLKYVINALLK